MDTRFPLTRFAPSPTGHLHLGHAASALFAWENCGKDSGHFILRIEDIDQTRCKTEFEISIYEDLHWLGLEWSNPVRRQSDHFQDYRDTLTRLENMGVLYPCFCTRKDIEAEIARSPSAPHAPEAHLYPGTCRPLGLKEQHEKKSAGLPYAIRLNVREAMKMTGPLRWHDREQGWQDANPDLLGDVVLARKDTPASYHLCVTLDDALQGVDLVTRGQDLFFSTHIHRLLQALLDLPTPDYHHHPLLTDGTGRRFAKRDKALTLREIRNRGFSAMQVRRMIERQDYHSLLSPGLHVPDQPRT